jgi:hypothetical protein
MIPNISTNTNAASGDASAGLDTSFNYQAAFQVGGSGSQDQSADLSAAGKDKMPLYIALGVLGVLALFSIVNE